jgi:outer membrane protein TolC
LTADSYAGEPATDPWLQQPPDPIWWAVFRDPVLTDLERRVAAENLDVQTATIRLAESRFQRGVAGAAAFPNKGGGEGRGRVLEKGATARIRQTRLPSARS